MEKKETYSIGRFYAIVCMTTKNSMTQQLQEETQTPRRMSTSTLVGPTNARVTKEAAASEEVRWALLELVTKWVPSSAAVETITMEKETATLAVETHPLETSSMRSFSLIKHVNATVAICV